MKIYTSLGEYYCALMEAGDFETWAAARIRCLHDKDGIDSEAEANESWWDTFRDRDHAFFVLFENDGTGTDNAIGIADITHLNRGGVTPQCAGLYVLRTHRNGNLSDLLYAAQLEFLVETTNHDSTYLWVDPFDIDAVSAAERNGFILPAPNTLTAGNKPDVIFVQDLTQHRALNPAPHAGLFRTQTPGF